MPLKVAGKLVLPGPNRQVALEGLTTVTLLPEDVVLEIVSQAGTGIAVRLLQLYPHVTEGRTIWIWNNSGATANIGRDSADPGYHITAYDLPLQTMPAGRVFAYRYYIDGGLPGSFWPMWHQI
jgi:hypothetical protein